MSTASPRDLHPLYELAAEASRRLEERLADMALNRRSGPQPSDHVVVLQEKYLAANRCVQFADTTIRWISGQALLAVNRQVEPNGPDLVRQFVSDLGKMFSPPPSSEPIQQDLDATARSMGRQYTDALSAWGTLVEEAWGQVDAASNDPDHGRMVDALVVAMGATIEHMTVSSAPAKLLRDELASQLRSANAPPACGEPLTLGAPPNQATGSATEPDAPQIQEGFRFELRGEFWAVQFHEETGLIQDSKGMRHIARLLASPHVAVPALALMGQGRLPATANQSIITLEDLDEDDYPSAGGTWDGVLDPVAREEYAARLRELGREREEAHRDNDSARLHRIDQESGFLSEELERATGLGGRPRRLGPPREAEKARQAVTQALKRVYKKLSAPNLALPRLVAHLERTIRAEGTAFVYRPTPPEPGWKL